jgi:hypothetical protein
MSDQQLDISRVIKAYQDKIGELQSQVIILQVQVEQLSEALNEEEVIKPEVVVKNDAPRD